MKTSKQPYNTMVGKSNAPNLQKTSANRKMLQKLTKHNHNVFLSLKFFREKNTDVVEFFFKKNSQKRQIRCTWRCRVNFYLAWYDHTYGTRCFEEIFSKHSFIYEIFNPNLHQYSYIYTL